jgi:hypothetical protein
MTIMTKAIQVTQLASWLAVWWTREVVKADLVARARGHGGRGPNTITSNNVGTTVEPQSLPTPWKTWRPSKTHPYYKLSWRIGISVIRTIYVWCGWVTLSYATMPLICASFDLKPFKHWPHGCYLECSSAAGLLLLSKATHNKCHRGQRWLPFEASYPLRYFHNIKTDTLYHGRLLAAQPTVNH